MIVQLGLKIFASASQTSHALFSLEPGGDFPYKKCNTMSTRVSIHGGLYITTSSGSDATNSESSTHADCRVLKI